MAFSVQRSSDETPEREELTHYMNVVVFDSEDCPNFSIVETAEEERQFDDQFQDVVEEKQADGLTEMNASTRITTEKGPSSAKEGNPIGEA